jgi:peptidoglycan-associated lipoprotein
MVVLVVFLGACSKKQGGAGGEGDLNGDGMSEENLGLQQDERFGSGNIPAAQGDGAYGENFRDIRFAFNSSVVEPEYHAQLERDAELLRSDSSLRVQLEGHCDNRGTTDYNLALGAERARAVGALLVSFGAPQRQITTISYGEEIPLDPANNEEAWAKNRRVHFGVFRGDQGK